MSFADRPMAATVARSSGIRPRSFMYKARNPKPRGFLTPTISDAIITIQPTPTETLSPVSIEGRAPGRTTSLTSLKPLRFRSFAVS